MGQRAAPTLLRCLESRQGGKLESVMVSLEPHMSSEAGLLTHFTAEQTEVQKDGVSLFMQRVGGKQFFLAPGPGRPRGKLG